VVVLGRIAQVSENLNHIWRTHTGEKLVIQRRVVDFRLHTCRTSSRHTIESWHLIIPIIRGNREVVAVEQHLQSRDVLFLGTHNVSEGTHRTEGVNDFAIRFVCPVLIIDCLDQGRFCVRINRACGWQVIAGRIHWITAIAAITTSVRSLSKGRTAHTQDEQHCYQQSEQFYAQSFEHLYPPSSFWD
jgi:hypothetical protein